VNPSTGAYAGQTILDFFPSTISRIFANFEELAFIVTPETSASGGDTVLGPNLGINNGTWKEVAIGDLLFSSSTESSSERKYFEENVLSRMKNGDSGRMGFNLTRDGTTEMLQLAFQPVKARVLLPRDPSDLSRGTTSSEILVYSLGIAYRASDVLEPWNEVDDDIIEDLERLRVIYLVIISAVSLIFVICTFYVSIGVTAYGFMAIAL